MQATTPLDLDHIPAIDITSFLAGTESDKLRVAKEISGICEQMGFLVISGHGIPDPLIAEAMSQSAVFYDQDESAKARWRTLTPGLQRGYQAFATRSLAKTIGEITPPDLRESFQLGPVDDHSEYASKIPGAAGSYAPNILPSTPPRFSAALISLYRQFERLSADLLRIFAVGLGLPEAYFADKIQRHFSIMSSHHYPALSKPPEPGQLRTGAHTDFGALTILAATQAQGGLEAMLPNGTWCPVTPRPGELVINLGDMMARWTNDRWKSTLHRVMTPPLTSEQPTRRQSIGYFMHPDYDANITCIPTCLAPGSEPIYPPIAAGEHIKEKIDRSNKLAS